MRNGETHAAFELPYSFHFYAHPVKTLRVIFDVISCLLRLDHPAVNVVSPFSLGSSKDSPSPDHFACHHLRIFEDRFPYLVRDIIHNVFEGKCLLKVSYILPHHGYTVISLNPNQSS